MQEKISTAFIQRTAEILAPAISGSQIVSVCTAFAVDFGVDIPHAAIPLTVTKKNALFENLRAFGSAEQYQVIYELCDRVSSDANASFEIKTRASQLKITLISQYFHLGSSKTARGELPVVVNEVRHWLSDFPAARKTYEEALQKLTGRMFTRNALDDLRLSLEALLRELLSNDKSLEKQVSDVGRYVKLRGGSAELANMFEKLIDYYSKYQNTYVKHDDAVPMPEAEFVLEVTACFMKHLIRIRSIK